MKAILFIVTFFLTSIISAQTTITWKDLDCEFEEVWSEENTVYLSPKFKKSIQKLEGKVICIRGKITTIDSLAKYYVLSEYELLFNGCDGRSKVIMELTFFKGILDLNFSKEYLLEGTLQLNKDDILQLTYILEDAEVIE